MTGLEQISHAEATPAETGPQHGALGAMAIGALGVVYGDIGTSPLYTFKTAIDWAGGQATATVALGILSLVVWTLIITTSIKYVAIVMRADNDGEGGILALMSLLGIKHGERAFVIALGIVGAAMLYGDGAITPAISVLSALEGIKDPLPSFAPYVLPLSVVVLLALFALQPQGTARIGALFGPIMVIWFLTIAMLGIAGIAEHPAVLAALDPRVGLAYLFGHGFTGFLVLGGVFLCATGAEALYADMGHFGATPIRLGWYGLVLPALVLNYAGQTAMLVGGEVGSGQNPFFALCPPSLQIPLVALATIATIIASQAIISGTFSMTRQAIQLGLCPRLHITQTSAQGYGQIYVGFVNWTLMLLTLALTLGFRSSDNLASAFGIAVALTMLLTSMLMFLAMREVWGRSLWFSVLVAGVFIVVDLSFVTANMMKVVEGGWVPLLVGSVLFFLMSTWHRGRVALGDQLERDTLPLATFIAQMRKKERIAGTAVYMTSRLDMVPVPLLHNLKHNKVLHQRIVLLHVVTANIPRVSPERRLKVTDLGDNFYTVIAEYGFMQHPNVPRVLHRCGGDGLKFNLMDTSFFVGRVKIVPAKQSALGAFRCRIFEIMHRNALAATDFFRIPPNRVIELGSQTEI
ncbi:MAG TPA: potassium transporter Kup [Bradyrhizobium sp.]|nr:potassium transporter Kup [Bradyrhizobium sp.]